MIKGGKFGANTQTGVKYEGKVDLATFLSKLPDYKIVELKQFSGSGRSKAYDVLYENKSIAQIYKQHSFYNFLESKGLKWKNI